jgi:hypothetical protein
MIVNISDNIITNAIVAISFYSQFTKVHDNILYNITNVAIYGVEAGGYNVEINNNQMYNVSDAGVTLENSNITGLTNEFIIINNNKGYNVGGGVNVFTPNAVIIQVNDNIFKYIQYGGIVIASGEQIQCNRNMIFDNVRSAKYAIDITGSAVLSAASQIYGTVCEIQNNHVGKFAYGVKVTSIGTLKVGGSICIGSECFNEEPNFTSITEVPKIITLIGNGLYGRTATQNTIHLDGGII